MRHRASWPPPQGLPVQDKLSLPQRPASHPSVMTRPSAAPCVSLVATPGLTENLRETGICLGRQKAQVGGAGCQPCQYDEDAPRGHEPTDGRQRLVTARRKSAEVVEVDQQKTARGLVRAGGAGHITAVYIMRGGAFAAPSLTHSCCLLWLVSQVHIYRPRPLGLTGKHSLLNPGPRDRLAQSRLPAVLTAVWPCHRLAVCDSALLSTMGIRPAEV